MPIQQQYAISSNKPASKLSTGVVQNISCLIRGEDVDNAV